VDALSGLSAHTVHRRFSALMAGNGRELIGIGRLYPEKIDFQSIS